VQIFGAGDYSMRVWLDPEKLAARGLTAGDVIAAIREQNVQVAAGQLGAPPARRQLEFQLNINTQGPPDHRGGVPQHHRRTDADGGVTHLRDVARVELGSDSYALRSLLDNKPAVAMPIFQRVRAPTRSRSPTKCAPPWRS
jgi:multidrug efflux pump